MAKTDKEKLYTLCMQKITERLTSIQEEMKQIQASANEETKSSAGDKYETGRALAQIEVERYIQQLAELELLRSKLQELQHVKVKDTVIPGALISTSHGVFYLSVGLGLIVMDKQSYYCISSNAPIGKLLLQKKVGEGFSFNGKDYKVEHVA